MAASFQLAGSDRLETGRHSHIGRAATCSRGGTVLLAVLIVLVILSLAAYQYSDLMSAEYQAAYSYTRTAQARAVADSGVHYTAALLSNPDTFANTLNNNPFDNPQVFQDQVIQQGNFQGHFNVIAILGPDDTASSTLLYRYGVIDECGKINLNALMRLDSSGKTAHDVLMALNLPNLTEDVINCILDWMDPDDDPRPYGAENDYYSSLNPPYQCKNGPLDSLEELLLVKGVTPQMLYGNDLNRNGILDPGEDNGTGVVDLGWSAYLTVLSREQNLNPQGQPRININGSDPNTLYTNLSAVVGTDMADFIRECRTASSTSISSIYELINKDVQIGSFPQQTTRHSPLSTKNPAQLKQLLP